MRKLRLNLPKDTQLSTDRKPKTDSQARASQLLLTAPNNATSLFVFSRSDLQICENQPRSIWHCTTFCPRLPWQNGEVSVSWVQAPADRGYLWVRRESQASGLPGVIPQILHLPATSSLLSHSNPNLQPHDLTYSLSTFLSHQEGLLFSILLHEALWPTLTWSYCPPRPKSKCPTVGSGEGRSAIHISFAPLTAYAVSSCSNTQSQLPSHGRFTLWKNMF